MSIVATRRVVLVSRRTEYEGLLERHATREQARFFLRTRGQDIDVALSRHRALHDALAHVSAAVPVEWRRARVDRGDLDRFLFEDDDVVIAVGQDGLVANVAKYLNGQPVIGLDPAPGENAGVLVPHPPGAAADLLTTVAHGREVIESRTMVAAHADDGQQVLALNEVFVGHRSHQSARYDITYTGDEERQSSSGLIVSTGTGATGWASSIHRERESSLALPAPCDPTLAFFVREAWPGPATGTQLTEGVVDAEHELLVTSRMDHGGVVFGDGIEDDHLGLPWGATVRVTPADRHLALVRG